MNSKAYVAEAIATFWLTFSGCVAHKKTMAEANRRLPRATKGPIQ